MPLFRPPQIPKETPAALRGLLGRVFSAIYQDLQRLFLRVGDLSISVTTYRASVGETKRVSPPAAGMGFVLPAPDAGNRGESIQLFIERPEGDVRVFVQPREGAAIVATVNGQESVTFSAEGLVVFTSNGDNRWSTMEAFSSASPNQLDTLISDDWGFDGSNDAVSMGNVYQKERTDSFSVSYWVKTGLPGITGVTDFVVLGNFDATANARGWGVYVHNDGLPHFQLANVVNTNGLDVVGLTQVNDGQLHHVVTTYAGTSAASGVQIYVDGVLLTKATIVSSLTGTIVAAGNSLRIGRYGANASLFFPGVLSYVSVWSSVLSAGNVTTLFNAGVRGNEAAVGTPQSLWHLDADDTPSTGGIADFGSSNFDGTPEGGLTNRLRPGAVLVRGPSGWQLLQPGAKGSPLLSTGGNSFPSFGTLDLFGIESQPANSLPVNATANIFPLAALEVASNTVILRAGGNIETMAVGTNTVLGRVAGNIVAAQLATGQVANNAITNALIRDSGALSVIGRSANSSGDPADISATAASGAVLRESGSTLGFGTIGAGSIADRSITISKLLTLADLPSARPAEDGEDAPRIPGPPGPIGPAGLQGPPGTPGDDGAAGVPGPPGAAGAVGATGATGDTGPAGSGTASQGPPGPPGEDGEWAPIIPGPTGRQGIQGLQGPPGPQGEDGAAGVPGPPGATGATGAAGGGGGGSLTSTTITLAFSGLLSDSAVVVDAAVGATDDVLVFWGVTSDTDEHSPEMDDVAFHAVAAAGSFTVRAIGREPLGGVYPIRYQVFA